MVLEANPWDVYAAEYEIEIRRRGPLRADDDSLAARLVHLLGNIQGKSVLDAGCGGGVLARLLDALGAKVTGLDLSPRLIEMAIKEDIEHVIRYEVANISEPQPEFDVAFDAIGSYLVLNDVEDYRGFAKTLARMAKPGAPIVLVFNNPYSAVVREHVKDYFASNSLGTYNGMWQRGIKARYYHRTLEDYLDAFLAADQTMFKLVDVPEPGGREWLLPKDTRFPMYTILAFRKPHRGSGKTGIRPDDCWEENPPFNSR
jgi:2-polyprenyl-3-methyl-5-hydroxy-6-metoxy-1,4-benzoquinol methylase